MSLLHEPLQAWRDITELHPLRAGLHARPADKDHPAVQYVSVPGPNGSHSHVLRVSPADQATNRDWKPKVISLEEAHTLATTQREHLQVLGRTGLHIPRYSSFIGQSPVYSSPALFNIVDHQDATPVLRRSLPTCKLIGQALARYLSWVEETDQPLVFDDIYKPCQYGTQPHRMGMDSDKRIWLIDIEPSFGDPKAPNEKGTVLIDELTQRAEALQRF